jgi:hypothetical protein
MIYNESIVIIIVITLPASHRGGVPCGRPRCWQCIDRRHRRRPGPLPSAASALPRSNPAPLDRLDQPLHPLHLRRRAVAVGREVAQRSLGIQQRVGAAARAGEVQGTLKRALAAW